MFQKILVPLDGSERAESIMSHVLELADRFAAELVLLQVIEPASVMPLALDGGVSAIAYADEMKAIEEAAKGYLADWRQRLQSRDIACKTILAHGPIVHTILETAAEESADLIAMCSHGRTGLSRVFYGSIATGVLHSTETPLLLTRAATASPTA